MPKRRNLNSLPHDLTKSYFSTLRYSNGGCMGDWLLRSAHGLQVDTVVLDIINLSITPQGAEKRPLLDNLIDIKSMLERELTKQGFEITFIKQAKITVKIPDSSQYGATLYCYPELKDIQGNVYKCGRIIADANKMKEGYLSNKLQTLKAIIARFKRSISLD